MRAILVTTALAMLTGAADAQNVTIVGEAGATLGFNFAEEPDDGEQADVLFGEFDARTAFLFDNGLIFAVDGTYRYDNFDDGGDFDDDENPEDLFLLAFHGLYGIGDNALVGGFLSVGRTESQDSADIYDYYAYGIEGQVFATPDLLVHGQLGVADRWRNGDSGEGMNDGFVVTLGADYFLSDMATVGLDIEYAMSDGLEDSDPGDAYGITIGYERQLNTPTPLVMDAWIRYDETIEDGDNDHPTELQVGLGLRVLFGGGDLRTHYETGRALDAPYIPARMVGWTEFLD